MLRKTKISRVETSELRELALDVLRTTYQEEKRWVQDAEQQLPETDLRDPQISWFLAWRGDEPAGVLRVFYEPPVAQYRAYNVKLLDQRMDVDAFLRDNRIAEIGRFAIVPQCRTNLLVAVALMRAATRETLERGFTHYITDVFENEPHSPYGFHTRVMGFSPVATHDHGELLCANRRITLILDLKAAYLRLKERKNWIFRTLTEDWDEGLHQQLVH